MIVLGKVRKEFQDGYKFEGNLTVKQNGGVYRDIFDISPGHIKSSEDSFISKVFLQNYFQ